MEDHSRGSLSPSLLPFPSLLPCLDKTLEVFCHSPLDNLFQLFALHLFFWGLVLKNAEYLQRDLDVSSPQVQPDCKERYIAEHVCWKRKCLLDWETGASLRSAVSIFQQQQGVQKPEASWDTIKKYKTKKLIIWKDERSGKGGKRGKHPEKIRFNNSYWLF